MLFTKSLWETPYRIRHDPFNRWRLAGIHHIATTFLIRAADALPNDPDGCSYLVADPEILLSTLDAHGTAKPRLFAIGWETLIPVSSLWTCTSADGGQNFLAYADVHGRLRACEPQHPDPLVARTKVLVWSHAGADAACLA